MEESGDVEVDASGGNEVVRRIGTAMLGCSCLIIFLTIVTGIPIAMLVIGGVYWGDCPIRDIPIILIVGGILTLVQYPLEFFSCLAMIPRLIPGGWDSGFMASRFRLTFQNSLRLAMFCWSIWAGIQVYGVYDRVNYAKSSGTEYCHPVLYNFAFWLVSLFLGGYALIVGAVCCIMAYVKMCNDYSSFILGVTRENTDVESHPLVEVEKENNICLSSEED